VLSLKPILLALASVCGLGLLAEPADRAVPADAARFEPTALNACVRDGEVIGREQHRRVFMNVEGRRLMLVAPQGFRVILASPDKVVLVNRDCSCILSFRIAAAGSIAAASLNADLCRAWLTAWPGDLKIQEEFSLTAANQSGPAFEVSFCADGLFRTSQVAFIPSPVGVLEFKLISSPEKFQAAKAEFHGLLLGFRISDANGKLEILPVLSES